MSNIITHMYVYIHTHICIFTYINLYIWIHIYIYKRLYINRNIKTIYIHIYIYVNHFVTIIYFLCFYLVRWVQGYKWMNEWMKPLLLPTMFYEHLIMLAHFSILGFSWLRNNYIQSLAVFSLRNENCWENWTW